MTYSDPSGYIPHANVTRIRLIHEEGIGSGGPWGIDGADDANGYTEECETYPTREAAVAAIPAFRARLCLPATVPIVEC